jgi:chemotaxis signal transduction protein
MQAVVFKLGDQEYAFDIRYVKEILRVTDITTVPQTEDYVIGIINLRGTVTPIISLYKKFGFPEKELSGESRIIILNLRNDVQVGVIVDSVTEVMNIAKENIESAGLELAVGQSFIEGIGKLENRLLLILNLDDIAGQNDYYKENPDYLHQSIITKLVLLFSLVLLVVCGTLGVVSYNFSSKAVVNEVDITFEQLAESGAMIVEEYVNAQIDSLEVLANNAFIRNPAISIGDKMEILMEEIERAGHIRMGIADLSGSLTSSNGAVSDIKDRSYFRDAAAGKPSVSDPIVSKVDGSVIMTYAVPITYNGQISAVLIAIRDGYDLSNLTDKLVFGEFGEAFILNKDGTTVAYNDRELVEKMDNDFENVKTDPELADLVELEKKMVAGEKGVGSYTYHGGIEFMGYAPVVGTAWSLAVVAPQTEVMAGVNNLRQVILLVSVIFLLIGIGAAYLIARSIVAPLRGVILEIQEVAKGNLAM